MNQSDPPFDFSKYYVQEDATNQEIAPKTVAPEEPFDFGKYYVKEPETNLQAVGRHVTRTGARVAETIVGLPGDFINFAKYLNESLPEPPKIFQREPNLIQRAGKTALEALPTSQDLKEVSSFASGGYTDPQGPYEEKGDEIASLSTALVNPSKAMQGFGALVKNIGISVLKATGVKGAGVGAELLGADESTKNKVELGTLFITGLINGKTADKYVGKKYDKARSLIPEGTMIETKGLSQSLDEVDKILAKGISTNTKNEVRSALNELKAKASGGAMEMEEVVQSFHDINERLTSKKLFEELKTSERKLLKSRYDLVKKEVGKEVEKYGKTNPEFLKEWRGANEGFATIAQSKTVSNWLGTKKQYLPHHLAGSLAVDLFLGHPYAIAGTAGGAVALKSLELLYRISNSPTLRDHYRKAIMEATNENMRGFVQHVGALDKEANKIDLKRRD